MKNIKLFIQNRITVAGQRQIHTGLSPLLLTSNRSSKPTLESYLKLEHLRQ